MEIPESASICGALRSAFKGVHEWKWDGRFGTVLAEFPTEKKQEVLGILIQYLTARWDSATIADAPEIVKKVKRHLGGLMADQLLILSDPNDDPLVYCAWWPWGDGQTISIRIGLFSETMNAEEKSTLMEALKAWFGI